MKYGLSKDLLVKLNTIFKEYPSIEKVILFGSRALGKYKNGSDIDLSLVGIDLDLSLLNSVANNLDDLLTPYSIDLVIYEKIDNPRLKEHIDQVGHVIYSRID